MSNERSAIPSLSEAPAKPPRRKHITKKEAKKIADRLRRQREREQKAALAAAATAARDDAEANTLVESAVIASSVTNTSVNDRPTDEGLNEPTPRLEMERTAAQATAELDANATATTASTAATTAETSMEGSVEIAPGKHIHSASTTSRKAFRGKPIFNMPSQNWMDQCAVTSIFNRTTSSVAANNAIRDREEDGHQPVKRKPIASPARGSDGMLMDKSPTRQPSPRKSKRLHQQLPMETPQHQGATWPGSNVSPSPSKQGGKMNELFAMMTKEQRADAFSELFFEQDKEMQKEVMKRILTDQRFESQVLPPSTKVSSRRSEHNDTAIEYNNQLIALSNPELHKPLDHHAFHYYQPNYLDGAHRSLNPTNALNEKFDLEKSARQAQLEHANSINNFVMKKNLSHEQRRLALWTAMGLKGMKEIVQSFGLNVKESESIQIIVRNMKQFIQRARLTNKSKGRACDDQRLAVSSVMASVVSSPGRKGGVSNRQIALAVGLPAGTAYRLAKQAVKDREMAKNKKNYKFLGPVPKKRQTRKVKNSVWDDIREDWIPNNDYVSHTPCLGQMVIKRDLESKSLD